MSNCLFTEVIILKKLKTDNRRRIKNILNRVTTYGRMIKFSHTIFALPFALAAVVLAAKQRLIRTPLPDFILAHFTAAIFLLLHEALYLAFAPLPGICHRPCPPWRLDRRNRFIYLAGVNPLSGPDDLYRRF